MTTIPYRPDIDALRAIAVLAVVGFHAFPNYIRGGFVGVDVFFVISGFLITGILRDGLNDPGFRLRDFYARRVRRIFPALVLVLTCCLVVSWYVLLPSEFRQIGKHVAAGAAFASNFVLWQESGYFDAAADTKPLLHLWSLGIEEQFYAVMPVAMLIGARFLRSSRLAAAIVIAGSFALCLWLTRQDATAAFYAPWTRVWELLAGGWLACRRRPAQATALDGTAADVSARSLHSDLASIVGVAVLAFAILGLDKTVAFPGAWVLLPVVATMLVIEAGPAALVNRTLLRLAPLVWIGLISYPLYLWHWPILKLTLISTGELFTAGERIGLVATSFFAAWLTYLVIEMPVRRRPARGKIIIALCVAMFLVGLAGTLAAIGAIAPRHTELGLGKILTATYDWRFPTPSLRPFLYQGNRFFGQRTSSPRVTLFIGDSNVEQFAPRVGARLDADPAHHRSAVFATKGGCLPIPGWNSPTVRCADRLVAALAYAQQPEVDTVVLGASWINILSDEHPFATVAPLGPLIRHLAATRRVFLVLNIPAGPEYDPRRMFVGSRLTHLAANERAEPMRLGDFLKAYGPLRDELVRLAVTNGAMVIDPLDSLCQKAACPVMSADGRPLYTDDHHMRPFHAEQAAGFIDQVLTEQAPGARR